MIRLKPASADDASLVYKTLVPEAAVNLQWFRGDITEAREAAYLSRMEQSYEDWLSLVFVEDCLVGTVGLHEIDSRMRTARLGVLIFRPEDRGHGHASAAIKATIDFGFNAFELHKVYVNVFHNHVEFYEKLGFRREGVLRDEYLLDGEYHDLVRLSVLEDEWDSTAIPS